MLHRHPAGKLVWILSGLTYRVGVCFGVQCLKNGELGDREGNTYQCEDPSKSDCCEQDSLFTCCEPASVTTLREQMILWGSIILVLLVILLLVICFKVDISYCSSEKTLKDKFLSLLNKKRKKSTQAKKGYDENPNIRSGDRDRILHSQAPSPIGQGGQPTPEEITEFHRYTTRRDSQGRYGQEMDLPLTARGVGVQFDRQTAWNS